MQTPYDSMSPPILCTSPTTSRSSPLLDRQKPSPIAEIKVFQDSLADIPDHESEIDHAHCGIETDKHSRAPACRDNIPKPDSLNGHNRKIQTINECQLEEERVCKRTQRKVTEQTNDDDNQRSLSPGESAPYTE